MKPSWRSVRELGRNTPPEQSQSCTSSGCRIIRGSPPYSEEPGSCGMRNLGRQLLLLMSHPRAVQVSPGVDKAGSYDAPNRSSSAIMRASAGCILRSGRITAAIRRARGGIVGKTLARIERS